ncbi:MAG TPA: type II secretion system protein GspL [Gammaproteobacteria bacterium]|nr:type II secretion system protein GspL [Gammaproteobacteria bacterium]
MAERLIIRLHDEGPVEWLVLDDHHNRIGAIQTGTLDMLTQQAAGRRVIVFVPGIHVTLLHAHLPSQNAQKIAQALPYALEERLAEDIDELHFAAGPAESGGRRGVAVVRRAKMDTWLARLADAGLRADLLLPDTLLLPTVAGEWHVAAEADAVLVRSGALAGFESDKMMAETVVALKLEHMAETERPDTIAIHAADPDNPEIAALATACAAAGIDVPGIDPLPGGTALALAGAGLSATTGFTLLQGDYRPRRDWEQRWRRWRLAAVLAAAWLIIAAAWQGVGYYRMDQQEAQLNKAIATQFRRALPGTHRMVNPRAQLESHLRALRAAAGNGPHNGLLAMLGALGEGIGNQSRLTTLSWHDNVLELQVTTPNVQTLGELRNKLAKKTGLNVQIESANAQGNSVDGRLRMGGTS